MDKNDQLMFSLILQYQQLAMMALGKIGRPGEGVRRDLDEAAFLIDILGMLEVKTAGNLPEELARLLKTTLSDLRLNYVDEKSRPEPAAAPGETSS
jgi:hypothetical protein